MQASFIIPLYNCLPLTQAMLASLRATLPEGLAGEIILVDDGSTDGTRAWLQDLGAPCRVLLNEANLGFAGACNRGATAARGELVFFLNNDLVLLPAWYEPMAAAFTRFADAGLVGNLQLNAASGAVDHVGIYFNHKGKPAHATDSTLLERWRGFRVVPAVTGACCAIRRDQWAALGGFDESYRNGCEDLDLALRALAAGRRNYVMLRSVVRHHLSQSPGRKLRDEQNTRRLVERWREQIATLAVRDWCRAYLARNWDGARDARDFAVARQAWLFSLGLVSTPPRAAVEGIRAAMELELARWRQLESAAS
ncbi:MAG TPA: glycosyltransferase [Lacunisphaera sp.]|jgi:GT2 family glycosyltransferase|nr:glycosyltransferase [Lacunisphaera sp.]